MGEDHHEDEHEHPPAQALVAEEYADDLVAYSNPAMTHCLQMNFQIEALKAKPLAISQRNAERTGGETKEIRK